MAAPPEKNIGDLSGQWVLNKSLSDDLDAALIFQGIGWWTRKAIGLATVTLHVKQYTTSSITHIDIDQTATGGIKGTTETRELNWEFKAHNDHIFGDLKGKTRWAAPDLIESDFLKEGWLDIETEKGGPAGEYLIETYVEAKAGWTGQQVWGFAVVDGERRYTRRVLLKKGEAIHELRMVYNWVGPEP